ASGDSIIAQFSEELDPESSQNENNFSVSGASIVSAELMSNLRTVKLKVTDMSLEENHNLIIFGIEDDNDPPNIQMAQSIQVDMPQPISFPLLINNAGVEVDVYEADQLWSSSVEYGHMNGNYQFTEHNIDNTDQDELYQKSLNRVVAYKTRVPIGIYSITMKLSENYYNETGDRSFDIFVEDSLKINNLDIYALAGKNNAFDTTISNQIVDDGILDIYFSAVNYGEGYEYAGPFLNGLEIHLIQSLSNDPLEATSYSISRPYPNPFNNKLTIPVNVKNNGKVHVAIFNISGQLIDVIHEVILPEGKHELIWDAKNYSSGLYIIQTKINNKVNYEKTILLK
ncbi:MAG: malectin domain-containing carbohydrate-binding protein, partial [Candidatus Neomarinimicrobiota bacterium]